MKKYLVSVSARDCLAELEVEAEDESDAENKYMEMVEAGKVLGVAYEYYPVEVEQICSVCREPEDNDGRCGCMTESKEIPPEICPKYNVQVLPDEDGNCSLCGEHRAGAD